MKTLYLRIRQQNESALRIARWLHAQPSIAAVYYPGLEAHVHHEIARRQMRGYGGVPVMVGEWGAWWDVEPGTNPGFLYQQNTMRDALVAALSLDIFNRHADRVRFANIAQTINVLQAMILTQGDKMLLTPTYHVFEMYTVHHDATLLPLTFDAGKYGLGTDSIAAVSASASRDKGGVIHITMSNVDPHAGRTVRADLRGTTARTATGRILTASAMNAYNTFEQPNALTPAPFSGARLSGDVLEVRLPPMSIVVLELK